MENARTQTAQRNNFNPFVHGAENDEMTLQRLDSLLALNAETGERLCHFQGVRHDLWDRDFPASPALFTVQRGAQELDAVAQTTKQGFVYVFDRTNGKPLFPIA